MLLIIYQLIIFFAFKSFINSSKSTFAVLTSILYVLIKSAMICSFVKPLLIFSKIEDAVELNVCREDFSPSKIVILVPAFWVIKPLLIL